MPRPALRATKWTYIKRGADGSWWIERRLPTGKMFRRKCSSRSEATAILDSLAAVIADQAKPKRILLSDLCERYRAENEARKSNWRGRAREEGNLCRLMQDPPIAEISKSSVAKYQVARLAEGVSPSTVNREVSRLSRLLSLAHRDGLISTHPLHRWQRLREPTPRKRILSVEEEERLRHELDDEDWRIVQIALLSGMRKSEQFGCRVEQVDLSANLLHLPDTKDGKGRTIPIAPALRPVIVDQLAIGTRWLCPNRSRSNCLHASNFAKRVFRPALARAGIENLRWHDLRRTFASRLIALGAPMRSVQALLGHASYSTTERYAHASEASLVEAVARLSCPL